MQPDARHWTLLLALGLIWGGTFMVMALALIMAGLVIGQWAALRRLVSR